MGLTLVGQLSLHLLYGEETFLYALNFAPLLVVVASLSTQTKARLVALLLTSILVIGVGINNWLQLSEATQILRSYGHLYHEKKTLELSKDKMRNLEILYIDNSPNFE